MYLRNYEYRAYQQGAMILLKGSSIDDGNSSQLEPSRMDLESSSSSFLERPLCDDFCWLFFLSLLLVLLLFVAVVVFDFVLVLLLLLLEDDCSAAFPRGTSTSGNDLDGDLVLFFFCWELVPKNPVSTKLSRHSNPQATGRAKTMPKHEPILQSPLDAFL